MGKRKKSSRKPTGPKKKTPLGISLFRYCLRICLTYRGTCADTTFTCLFCHHDNSVTVKLDRKEGIAQLVCRVCDQRYQSKVNRELYLASATLLSSSHLCPQDLTEPIDIYSEWIDAADAADKEQTTPRRPVASSSRPRPAPPSIGSEDD